jgi:hypothetical protein
MSEGISYTPEEVKNSHHHQDTQKKQKPLSGWRKTIATGIALTSSLLHSETNAAPISHQEIAEHLHRPPSTITETQVSLNTERQTKERQEKRESKENQNAIFTAINAFGAEIDSWQSGDATYQTVDTLKTIYQEQGEAALIKTMQETIVSLYTKKHETLSLIYKASKYIADTQMSYLEYPTQFQDQTDSINQETENLIALQKFKQSIKKLRNITNNLIRKINFEPKSTTKKTFQTGLYRNSITAIIDIQEEQGPQVFYDQDLDTQEFSQFLEENETKYDKKLYDNYVEEFAYRQDFINEDGKKTDLSKILTESAANHIDPQDVQNGKIFSEELVRKQLVTMEANRRAMLELEQRHPGSVISLNKIFGITNFFRYRPEDLLRQYQLAQKAQSEQKTNIKGYVLFQTAAADYNDAFDNPVTYQMRQEMDQYLQAGYLPIFMEMNSTLSYLRTTKKTTDTFGPADIIIINGHGTHKGIQFNRHDLRDAEFNIKEYLKYNNTSFQHSIKENGHLVLNSCSTGDPITPQEQANLAAQLSENLQTLNITVHSPDKDAYPQKFNFAIENNGRLNVHPYWTDTPKLTENIHIAYNKGHSLPNQRHPKSIDFTHKSFENTDSYEEILSLAVHRLLNGESQSFQEGFFSQINERHDKFYYSEITKLSRQQQEEIVATASDILTSKKTPPKESRRTAVIFLRIFPHLDKIKDDPNINKLKGYAENIIKRGDPYAYS